MTMTEWGEFLADGFYIYGTIFSIFCLYLDKKLVPKASKIKWQILRVVTLFVIVPIIIVFIFNELASSLNIEIASVITFPGDVGGSMLLVCISWLLFGTKRLKATETSTDIELTLDQII